MTQKVGLVGKCHLDIAIYYNTLAAQARVDTRVNRPVDKILFLVRYLLDIIHPLVYIHLAGTASANAAAVMLQLDTVLKAYVQNRLAFGNWQFNRFKALRFKVYFNFKNVHFSKSNKIT